MKLATFRQQGPPRHRPRDRDGLIDVERADCVAAAHAAQPAGGGPRGARSPPAPRDTIGTRVDMRDTVLAAPIGEPRKFLGWASAIVRTSLRSASGRKDIQIHRIRSGLPSRSPASTVPSTRSTSPRSPTCSTTRVEMAVVIGDGAATCAPPKRHE